MVSLNKPLVSIVSGFYNREELVESSINSLIYQSYKDIEIIVFDDDSEDNTYNELSKFDDSRIFVIKHGQNIGFVNGIINAINKASGDYIAIHGAGDISFKDRISKQIEFMEDDVAVVGCYTQLVEDGKYTKVRKDGEDTDRIDGVPPKKPKPGTHGCALINRRKYDLCGGYRREFKYAQDADLWLRISQYGKIRQVPETLYSKYVGDGTIRQDFKKQIVQRLYSEMAWQSLESKLSNENDIIDIYGDNAIHYINFNDRLYERIYKLLKYYYESGENVDEGVRFLMKFNINKEKKNQLKCISSDNNGKNF